MADPELPAKSWWSTLPGVLTALAGIVAAVAGLLAVLSQTGLIGGSASTAGKSAAAETAPQSAPSVMPALIKPALSADAAAARPSTPPASTAAMPVARSPAEVLAGLKAREFKGLAVTHKDGTVVTLMVGTVVGSDPTLRLTNGQSVEFERMVSVTIEQPWDGSAMLMLTNGQLLEAKLTDYTVYGKNDLGQYRELRSNLRRIDFVR